VYRAIDTQSENRQVAVKQINLHGLPPQEIIEVTDGFHRELEFLSGLSHPHLPRIYEHFTDPEYWYLVMDFVEGLSLDHYLDDRRRSLRPTPALLPLEEICDIGLQLCSVLDYLHSRQPPIIFRDLKPENILRTEKGHLFLIDFGIARRFKPGQSRDTIPLGSPGYAAPEQYGKAQTTPRSDIFSLGALLHYLLTGNDPAEAPLLFVPSHLSSREGAGELASLVLRMVALDADKRPERISQVQQEIDRFSKIIISTANGEPIWMPPPADPPPADQTQLKHLAATYRDWNGGSLSQMQKQRGAGRSSTSSRRKFLVGTGAVVVYGAGVVVPLLSKFFSHDASSLKAISSPNASYRAGFERAMSFPLMNIAWSPDTSLIAFVRTEYGDDNTATGLVIEVGESRQQGRILFSQYLDDKRGLDSSKVKTTWSLDGQLAWGGKGIEVWRTSKGSNKYIARYTDENVEALSWSPDGQRIAFVGERGAFRVWNVKENKIAFTAPDSYPALWAFDPSIPLSWSPDGKCILSNVHKDIPKDMTNDRCLALWDAQTGRPLIIYEHIEKCTVVAWSPNSQYFASVEGQFESNDENSKESMKSNISIIGISQRFMASLNLKGKVNDLAWSHNGKYLAVSRVKYTREGFGEDSHVEVEAIVDILQGRDGRHIASASTVSRRPASTIAWSPDNQRLFGMSESADIVMWELADVLNGARVG
jgi:serine/threonine protein kinase